MFPIEEKYFSAGLNAWDPGLIQMLFFILSQPQPREHFDGVKLYEIYKTDFDPLVYKAGHHREHFGARCNRREKGAVWRKYCRFYGCN